MDDLAAAAAKAIQVHGFTGGSAPGSVDPLREEFARHAEARPLSVENRFYAGYSHEQLDWSRPVHAIFVDFKGDSMQLGMLLQRLEERGEQYVFVTGPPLPGFNGGWHFSAVNDFERPSEQGSLAPAWRNIRVWTRVTYVCQVAADGSAALTPRTAPDNPLPITSSFKLSNIYFTGGLMPHTLIANHVLNDKPMSLVIAKHLELGSTFAVVGHGLDVLLACGMPAAADPPIAGFEAAVYPKQDHLLEISKVRKSPGLVCRSAAGASGGCPATLVSASFWGPGTAAEWLLAAGLPPAEGAEGGAAGPRLHVEGTGEEVLCLDLASLPGMAGPTFSGGDAAPDAPRVAVFADDVADPVEVYTIVSHLMREKIAFHLISHSTDASEAGATSTRVVTTETVFGNARYPLSGCACALPTTPANLVPAGTRFDSFFVAGGQCPYHMMQDPAITAIMDSADIAAAVCHGPEALIGSKWMNPTSGKFTAYYGCVMSFRDALDRFSWKPPPYTHQDSNLFSGNAPNATQAMVSEACTAIAKLRSKI